MPIPARSIPTQAGAQSLSTGKSMERHTHGRAAARLAPAQTLKDRTPRERCCVSSSHTCNVRVRSAYRRASDMTARETGQRRPFERSPATSVLLPHYHMAARRPSLHLRRFVDCHYKFVTRCYCTEGVCSPLLIGHPSPPARPINPSLARELGFLIFGQFILSHPAAAVTADLRCGVS